MNNVFKVAAAWGMLSAVCVGQARWCQIEGRGPHDGLAYPDTARRARVFGVVKARLEFLPSGEVRAIDRISGPPLLFALMKQQMLHWVVRTDAEGANPCQAVVVTSFNLDDNALWRDENDERLDAPSVLRLLVYGESFPNEVVVTTNDPVYMRSKKHSKGSARTR